MVLLDTSFLYTLYNQNDPKHPTTKKTYSQMLDGKYGRIILLDYVLDELMTLIAARTKSIKLATQIGEIVLQDTREYMTLLMCGESEF